MGLNLGAASLLSLAFLPAIFLVVMRFLSFSSPVDLVLLLMISEGISLVIALVIVVYFKVRARVPLGSGS